MALQPEVDRAASFSQGLAAVRVGGKYGYMDKQGRLVIAAQYSFARPFQDGMAHVGEGRVNQYIRPDGSVVWRSTP